MAAETDNPVNPQEILRDARLLLVTDPRPDLTSRVEAAVRGGVDVVQLRDKRATRGELLPLAERLREICVRSGTLFTVNDDVELARLSGADGVHLGQEDETIAKAREALGPGAVVGRSVGSVEEAREAVREGADYLGVGTVFATPTRPSARVRVISRKLAPTISLSPPAPFRRPTARTS